MSPKRLPPPDFPPPPPTPMPKPFDLHAEIEKQRTLGEEVIAPLSMLRCSECGDLLDFDGYCKNHGATDAAGE